MAEQSTMARPYAKAVFEIAQAEGSLDQWATTLDSLAQAMAMPELSAAVGHPSLKRAQQADLLVSIFKGGLSAQEANLVRLLAENGRLSLLPQVAEQYDALKDESERRVEVEITTAVPVEASQQSALTAAIGKRLSRELEVSWATDESLIAGARIRTGDMVIDGSFAGELSRLQSALTG